MSDIFVSAGGYFEISLWDMFVLKSPITPSKVKWSAAKIHQTFSPISKALWLSYKR